MRDWVGAVWICIVGLFSGAISYYEVEKGTG